MMMKDATRKYMMILVTLVLTSQYADAQIFAVEKMGFNSPRHRDFSPIFYRDGLVFSSTRKHDVMVVYASPENSETGNMWYVPLGDSAGSMSLFSNDLTTSFHDGPATFSSDGSIVYYSRNLNVNSRLRNVKDEQNQLGIFRAELTNGKWTNITPFPYNSSEYSLTTPALSRDGSRIYFASNKTGGYGGADLWYCNWSGSEWLEPINLGETINTAGNESYPFESESGILYFASDGWGGLGKKDIFYTSETNGTWIDPVHMDERINSQEDDFGLITDKHGREGYFSSDRNRNDDIYRFVTDYHTFLNCNPQQKNYYCFLFDDEGGFEEDTVAVWYEWDFGDGEKAKGIEVEHCFPGPGKYMVQLNIMDSITGETFLTQAFQEVEIVDAIQPFISTPDTIFSNQELIIDGLNSNLPGMEITEYYWDFGDGSRAKGASVNHVFEAPGTYRVQLGVSGTEDAEGNLPKTCVHKMIEVVVNKQGGEK